MVAALRAGTKTQTRRSLNPQPADRCANFVMLDGPRALFCDGDHPKHHSCEEHSYPIRIAAEKGDHLWVRESYYQRGHWAPVEGAQTKGGRQKWGFVPADDVIAFDQPAGEVRLGRHGADPGTVCWHKRLGRFMPRSASRMTLVVTDVRVQRLQEISEEDAIAEGVWNCRHPDGRVEWRPNPDNLCINKARYAYSELWQMINGAGSWAANPWVVAYSFTVERRNIDEAVR
jgi:hypothetical protein